MNKLKKLLTIFAVTATIGAGIAGIAGCDGCNGDDGKEHTHSYTWTDNEDGTHNGKCDVDGCDKPEVKNEAHVWGDDDKCEKCEAEKQVVPVKEYWKVTIDLNDGSTPSEKDVEKGQKLTGVSDPTREGYKFTGWKANGADWTMDTAITGNITIVAQWAELTKATLKFNNGADDGVIYATEKSGQDYFAKPADPKKPYSEFGGWFTDEGCTKAYDFNTPVTGDTTLYAKWEPAYDTITTEWDFLAGASIITANPSGNVVLPSDMTFQGKFLLGSGARFDIGSKNDINTQGKKLEFTLSGEGTNNAFAFKAEWASSSKTGPITVTNKETGEKVYESATLNNKDTVDASKDNLPAGTYVVTTVASIKIYSFTLTEKLPQSPVSGIELDTNSIEANVLLGRDFSDTGLTVSLTYENGRKDVIELTDPDLKVEAPQDFKTSAGVKTITVTYSLDSTTSFTKTYTVNVCEVKELVCYDYVLDSKRITQNLQTLFGLNETFNNDNFVVKAKCLVPGTTDKFVEFKLESSEFTVTKPSMNTVGEKSVEIVYGRNTEIATEYKINVAAIPDLSEEKSVTVNVNPAADISATGDYNFHTINDALTFLKLANVSEDAEKFIKLQANTVYKEKVEIAMKNVTLTTVGFEESNVSGFNYEAAHGIFDQFAVIEWGALNGELDPGETITHSTDGSATVSIRPEAENFKAIYVTFKNTYNTNALYKESLKITSDSQAVAALVQADKAVFMGCKFTSYHDTLYAQVGRQYYDHCLIEGHTDYIFGYNATAYFNTCLIHTIGSGATDNNGGYVVATKGHNKGADTDAITYGYIFNHCEFTGNDDTADGSVSIARGWDVSMKIMVMNSEISSKFSKEAYGEVTASGKNMNDRYGKMNADPVADNLLEYNNTGAGAITADLAKTCKVVTADVAADYENLNKVFGAFNGKMVYADAWNPIAPKDATVVLKTSDDTEVQTMENVSWSGSVVTKAMLDGALDLEAGTRVEGYYSDKACTKAYDFATVLESENVIYVKLLTGDVKQTETFNASSDGYAGKSLKDNAYNGTSFNIVAGGAGDTKSSAVAMTATADDESGLTFNTAFVPVGSGRTYTITAVKDVTITVYYTVSNGDIIKDTTTTAFTKGGELTVDEKAVTSSGAKSNNVAYAYTLTLKAGETAELSTDASSNRLVIFGLVAEY